VDVREGRYAQAADHLQQGLSLFRQAGDKSGEADALNGLGELSLAESQPDNARGWHTCALALADHIGEKYEQARAHDGLAAAHCAAGDLGQSREHWQAALALYADLGVPEAARLRPPEALRAGR
jgi:tetratricopeptide (TPR) repeat protein